MYRTHLSALPGHFEKNLSNLRLYLKENRNLIFTFSAVALAAYGFELFQLNLTIDEEIHATASGPVVGWIAQGRWGMYLLNKFILPYTILPFVPLFLALVFHISAALLLLESWVVTSGTDRFVVGSMYVALPTMAYMYTFSTINYGIGIGLFCTALSLFIYAKNEGLNKFWAVIPASFAIAIYQGFIPALAAVFLVYIIHAKFRLMKPIGMESIAIAGILILSVIIYYVTQRFILMIGIVPELLYVSEFFDFDFLRQNFSLVFDRIWSVLLPVYLGKKAVYSIQAGSIGVLLAASFLGLFIKLFKSRLPAIHRIFVIALLILLLVLPFMSGFLMQGYFSFRFLVALPAVVSGVVMLGMLDTPRFFKISVTLLASFCLLQFITSTNHLFASSHLALEADRMLASRLIGRIEEAQVEAGISTLRYIEVIGYYGKPSTELIPKIETIGASFFEWDEGNPLRISGFLQTAGLPGLTRLTPVQRARIVSIAESMAVWPHRDSVRIVEDIVLIKFGEYSAGQRAVICSTKQSRNQLQDKNFCRDLTE